MQQDATSAAITKFAVANYNSNNIAGSLSAIATQAKKQSNVSTAVTDTTSVTATYKSGEKERWYAQVPISTSPNLIAPSRKGHFPQSVARHQPRLRRPRTQPRRRHMTTLPKTLPTLLTIDYLSGYAPEDVEKPLGQIRNAFAAAGWSTNAA